MNITLNGTKITQDTRNLAFEKNNNVDEIVITVDTDESWSYKLDVKYPDKYNTGNDALYNIIDLPRSGNICSVTLDSKMLPFNGKYTMQLRGINGDKVYHSDIFEAWVKYSIEPGEIYDPVPSEFYQIEDNISEINAHPPMPDQSGFWKIWNSTTHEYELSNIPLPDVIAGDKSYVFTQTIASSKWLINHNLYKQPSVTVVDSSGNEVAGDVEYNNLNTLMVTFSAPFAGRAYLN